MVRAMMRLDQDGDTDVVMGNASVSRTGQSSTILGWHEDNDDDEDEDEDEDPERSLEGHFADFNFSDQELDFIEKGWGDSATFMLSYGLKFYKDEDCEEAKAIVRALMSSESESEPDDE